MIPFSRYLQLLIVLLLPGVPATLQATFSIVAVDTLTGEIGSAGASCVGPINGVGAFILSDVLEGVGGIHTQAFWLGANQVNARNQMLLGKSPQEIIDWLVANDAQGNPTRRQYGIVDLTRGGESAAYTGVNCSTWRGHLTGRGYAIQGNILLGPQIVDSMEAAFLNTAGPLADRLMAALEAAKVVGADTRCGVRNTSSQSAFIKVVRLGDGNTPYLQEIVPDSPVGTDPIDLLRGQYDQWKSGLAAVADPFRSMAMLDSDSLAADGAAQALLTVTPRNNADSLLSAGLTIDIINTGDGRIGPVTDPGNGTYVCTVTAPAIPGTDTLTVRVVSGSDTVTLAQRPTLRYFSTTGIAAGNEQGAGDRFQLLRNYPNPFNPATTIRFALPTAMSVRLDIVDVMGRRVRAYDMTPIPAGWHEIIWDGRDDDGKLLSSGVYIYRLQAGEFMDSRKMLLVR